MSYEDHPFATLFSSTSLFNSAPIILSVTNSPSFLKILITVVAKGTNY